MKQKLIEVATFIIFLLPLLVILASPTFSSQALGLDKTSADTQPAWGYTSQTFYALGGMYDGWILESGAFTGIGGLMDSTKPTMPIGDNAQNRQYRGIISFDTSKLPNGAYLDSATLYLRGNGFIGISPFTPGDLEIDTKKGAFSSDKNLQLSDFRAPASSLKAAMQPFCYAKAKCAIPLPSEQSLWNINLLGLTQFRLRFTTLPADFIPNNYQIFTGDTGTLANKPMLIVRYYP